MVIEAQGVAPLFFLLCVGVCGFLGLGWVRGGRG